MKSPSERWGKISESNPSSLRPVQILMLPYLWPLLLPLKLLHWNCCFWGWVVFWSQKGSALFDKNSNVTNTSSVPQKSCVSFWQKIAFFKNYLLETQWTKFGKFGIIGKIWSYSFQRYQIYRIWFNVSRLNNFRKRWFLPKKKHTTFCGTEEVQYIRHIIKKIGASKFCVQYNFLYKDHDP